MDLGTIFTYAAYGVAALAGLGVIGSGLYTIQQEHQGLVTRFGKHVRTNDSSGLKFKIPLIESVKKISMQEFQADENLETKTTDNLFVKLPIAIHFQVSDPATFHFKKGNAVELMKKVVSAAVREYTSKKDFQELYDERQEIKEGVLAKIESKVAEFGLQINDIVIDEPSASDEVKETFDRVRSSALEKDAAKNEAEAEYIKKVKSAEADKDRDLLRGEGAAGYREKIFAQYAEQINELVKEGTPREEAVKVMMKIMELDTYREIGDKGNAFVITGGGSNDSDDFASFLKKQHVTQDMGAPAVEQNNSGPAAPVATPS